jgi:2-amino-4-hydroxy-6-hydroxymethyldihydropteridine diphosphokinase
VNGAVSAFVGLGSNLETPVRQLTEALDAIARLPGTTLVRRSAFYRTAPVGFVDQPDFVNAVAWVRTELDPRDLLSALLRIETEHGRVRALRNGPRTLDLDLLLHGDEVRHEASLTLPHPRMHERAFVMVPLAEIAADVGIPGVGVAHEIAARLRAVQRVDRMPDGMA